MEVMDGRYIIYLKKEMLDMVDFMDKDKLEDYFKHLFKKLKRIYNVEISGYYNIKVYIDNYYGVVLDIDKEEFQYYDYLENEVDMRIILINTNFLYEVSDIPRFLKDKVNVYKYNDTLYLMLKEKLGVVDMDYLMEFSKIIYDDKYLDDKLIGVDTTNNLR